MVVVKIKSGTDSRDFGAYIIGFISATEHEP